MVEDIGEVVFLTADIGFDVVEDRLLIEIIFDDPRDVGVDGLVVSDAGSDRVGDRHLAGIERTHHAGNAQH